MNGIDKQWMLSLLHIIRIKGNLEYIISEEHTIAKLNKTMRLLKRDGYIDHSDNSVLNLTEKGILLYYTLCRELKLRGLYRFLMPDIKHRMNPVSMDDIYIPKKQN